MYAPDSPHDLARKLVPYFQRRQSNNGFFIEAGAANGAWQSNTLYLETTLGWSGLLIEPNKHCFEICKEIRQMKGLITTMDNHTGNGLLGTRMDRRQWKELILIILTKKTLIMYLVSMVII